MEKLIIIVVFVLLVWIFLIFKFKKTYTISKQKKEFFNQQLKKIINLNSYKEQIIDIDKLYHKILLEAGYNWTFWEILKSKPSEIWNINNIWELHKIRNTLVHDFDSSSEQNLKEKVNNYILETKKILKNF